jgi:uncharacterized protein YcaQ
MAKTETLSLAEARRIALAAQGFADSRPRRPDKRHFAGVVARLGVLQIDSVNVLVRSHYLPAFSRLGPYSAALLDKTAWGKKRALFEYWGHEASLLPLELHPLLRWRMARAERGKGTYGHLARFRRERHDFIERVAEEITARGPLGASELAEGGRGRGSWWGWSDGKTALEWLFWAGRVTTAERRGFERIYDLPERVIPPAILAQPTPDEAEAQRQLLLVAARALGVAAARDLRDYFRLDLADTTSRLAELVEAGALVPVAVEGWKQPAFLDPTARLPRRVDAAALLSPFDSLIWERARTHRLFDFHFRLEIYTPAARRQHGYYVLPFLLGDLLVARVDLKAVRQDGVLQIHAAHAEPESDHGAVAAALAAELRALASWLGLERVRMGRRGDLAPALRAALARGK